MERYYESLGAPSIPRDLLAGCLDETLEVERELEDPFLGNCLDVADYIQGVDGPAMVFSRGAAFGDVCVAEFATGCGNAVARFRNPVLQVLTGGAVSHGKRLLAVRNHASASILAFGRKQDSADDQIAAAWESQMVDVLPFEHRPLDVAINPTLSAEVAVLLDGGDISIWNGEQEARCWPIAKYDQPPAPYGMKRKSCQYGAHPRTLIVAHVDRVDTVDFRSPSIRPATVFESRSELVRAFRRDPRDPFRVVLATTSRTALIDTRFHGRTLLEWDYQNNREAPCGVEFLPPVDHDSSASFVTWARVSGEIQAYTYGSPAAQMPERKARAGDDGEGALALPTIHELISPSWTAPPVSLARPTQLDPCRRSPQHPSVPRQRRYQKQLHNQHIEREEDPGWPPLRGLAISRQAGTAGKTVLMQLADDGAIYTQPIVNGERSEEDSLPSHVEAESEGLDNAMYNNPEQVAVTQYKAHRRKDWRSLAKFLRFAALNLDRASGEASPSAPPNLSEFLKSDDGTRCTTFYELAIRANRPPPPVTSTLPGASFWAPGIFNLSPNLPAQEESHNVLPLTMRGFLSRTPSSLDDARATVREVLGSSQSHDNDDDEEMALRHIAHDIRLASLVTTPPSQRQFIPDNDPSQPHSFTAGTLESQHTQFSQFSQFSQYSQPSQQTDFTQPAALDPTTATGGNQPRHQSTLHMPYAPAPIRLSATATEFRKRWTNPEDYYGPTAIYHEGPAQNNNQQKRRRANDRKRSRTLSVGPSAMATVQTPTRVTPVAASASSLAVPTPVAPAVVVAAAAAASQVSAAAPSPMRPPTLSMSMSMDIAGSPARAPATQGSARKKPARKKGF